MKTLYKFALVMLLVALVPLVASAAFKEAPSQIDTGLLPKGPDSVIELIGVITDWIFTVLIVLAIIFFIIAAFHYLGGSEERVKKAHRMLVYTAVALAVGLLSFGITTVVKQLVAS